MVDKSTDNSLSAWVWKRMGELTSYKSNRGTLKKNSKPIIPLKRKPQSSIRKNTKLQAPRRPLRSKFPSSKIKMKNTKGHLPSKKSSKAQLQDKQFLVGGPVPVGPAFPFGLTPSALLIPAIPTLVGKLYPPSVLETGLILILFILLFIYHSFENYKKFPCRPRSWASLGCLPTKPNHHRHILHWFTKHKCDCNPHQ